MKTKKSFIFILIILITVFSIFADGKESGKLGKNITWEISYDSCLTISGTGPMDNYYSSRFEKYGYDVETVVIAEGITSVGNSVFKDCENIETVELPETLTRIGDSAFEGCNYLKSINIPETVMEIGKSAFEGCDNIISMKIPSGVTEIKDYAFNGCYSLKKITLPETITKIGNFAFEWCENLESINLSANLEKIGKSALLGCRKLNFNINIGENLRDISPMAFFLTNIKLKSVDENNPSYSLYKGDLYNKDKSKIIIAMNKNETKFQLPNSVTKIGANAFVGCNFENIVIPETITEIGNGAFQECGSLKSVEIPGSVKIIPSEGFSKNDKLERVVIKEGVCEISRDSFFSCQNLKFISIPASLRKIGENAFYGCNFENIKVAGNNSWNVYSWGSEYTGINLTVEKLDEYSMNEWNR